MKIRAKYWAFMKDGSRVNVCACHLAKVARRIDNEGRLALKRGVRQVGSLPAFTSKTCGECRFQSS